MAEFNKWIRKTHPHYFFEQSNTVRRTVTRPTVQPVDARYQKELNNFVNPNTQKKIQSNPRDFILQVNNITAYDMMKATRTDKRKFQADVARLMSSGGGNINIASMTMSKENMFMPQVVIVISGNLLQQLGGEGTTRGGIVNLSSGARVMVIPQEAYVEKPSAQNPVGVLRPDAIEVLAHEAGHLAQARPSEGETKYRQMNTGDIDPELAHILKEVDLPYELGTRFGFVKNINSKNTLSQIAKNVVDRSLAPLVDVFVETLPDDEMERMLALINLREFATNLSRNREFVQSLAKYNMEWQTFQNYIIAPFYNAVTNYNENINQFFGYVNFIKQKEPANYKKLIEKLRYAYPRVAAAQPYGGRSQEREMA